MESTDDHKFVILEEGVDPEKAIETPSPCCSYLFPCIGPPSNGPAVAMKSK